MRSFQQHLPELEKRSIRLVAVSMDSPEQLREHKARMGWTFPLLSDSQGEAVRAYDLLHRVSDEQVVSRPGEFLIDPTGTVRWVDLTEDYRIRTRPETVLATFDRLNVPAW